MSEFTIPPPPVPGFGPAEPILEQFRLTPFAKMAQAGAQHAAGTVANDLQPALDIANDPRNAWIGTNPVGRGAIEGLAALKAVLGIFAGPKAATANLAKLAEAQALQKAGTRGEDIWHQTGWFQAPDEGWRFEIPDGWANLSNNIPSSPTGRLDIPLFEGQYSIGGIQNRTLGDTLNHEALYQAYPELKSMPVRSTGMNLNIAGAYDPEKNQMYLAGGKPDAMRNTVLHETQHAVQGIEDTARGGSPGHFLPSNFDDLQRELRHKQDALESEFEQDIPGISIMDLQSRLRTGKARSWYSPADAAEAEAHFQAFQQHPAASWYRDLLERQRAMYEQQKAAMESYKALGGEVESRLVEQRSNNLGPPMPQPYPPSEYDVPPARQIIRRTIPKGQP